MIPANPTVRARALWLLARLHGDDAVILRELLERIGLVDAAEAQPPYKDPEWLPESRTACYQMGWDAAAQMTLERRGVSFQCKCGRLQNPPAGVRQWRCDCGAMTFIASGGR